jgi:hypothetical protein
MPAFAARASRIARGLAREHGFAPHARPAPPPDPDLARAGRALVAARGGLDCGACHAIGPAPATKVFEGQGPNLKLVRERLRPRFFPRWMHAPARIEPGTKMPQFFADGESQLTEYFDGDAARQIEALWHYLLQGRGLQPPATD